MAIRTLTAKLTQGGANDYVEKEFRFPSRSKITVLRADVIVESHVILDEDHIELCIAKGQIGEMKTPLSNQCLWYKDYLQVGAQAGGLDLSWLAQNLPSFTGEYLTVALDSDSYAVLTLTAYFTLLVNITQSGVN